MRRSGLFLFLSAVIISLVAAGCGGGGGGDNPTGPGGTGDYFSYSIDGGLKQTFTESSSCAISGDCDPYILSMAMGGFTEIAMEAGYNGIDFDESLVS